MSVHKKILAHSVQLFGRLEAKCIYINVLFYYIDRRIIIKIIIIIIMIIIKIIIIIIKIIVIIIIKRSDLNRISMDFTTISSLSQECANVVSIYIDLSDIIYLQRENEIISLRLFKSVHPRLCPMVHLLLPPAPSLIKSSS